MAIISQYLSIHKRLNGNMNRGTMLNPAVFSILKTRVSLNPKFVNMNKRDWEQAFHHYAENLDEYLDEERHVALNVASGIQLDLHFYFTADKAESITATGTAILMKPGEDPSHAELMFQAELWVKPNSPHAATLLLQRLNME